MKPSTGCLFEPIKWFAEFANTMGSKRISKAERLLHADLFLQKTIEKIIMNIKLLHGLMTGSSKCQNNIYGGWFDHGAKTLFIIESFLLIKALGNETGLVASNRAIYFSFDTKHPFALDHIHV